MTIGIAAYGPGAGLAVFRALSAVESVSRGAIGGFASFAVITADGRLVRSQTQRGGSGTLFLDGETTGVEPPPEVAAAPLAAVMSSGPDRPEPLAQFVAADAAAGLVTGHRLPNTPGRGGVAINADILERMRAGAGVAEAVGQVMEANPQADAGVIAVDLRGRFAVRDSERVALRPDLGRAWREGGPPGAPVRVAVLHNAVQPARAVAALAADVAMHTLAPPPRPDRWLTVGAGTPVVAGPANAVRVDAGLRAVEVVSTDTRLLQGYREGAALYIGSTVLCDGAVLGTTLTEPYVTLRDGRIVTLSGQTCIRVGFLAG